ncbi:MAG TPA: glycerol-3-phosphate dehydrogenase/oxidase, partial [Candidatus Baltobacteraceae bacterium]|nr:glycerol-3-phosphate dehydrogenase/oxidase [Candidatus Baltobacteraceae bacterium]
GTSSRSTKLVHGGVRYLAQGNVHLVREALYERSLLLRNAQHIVKSVAFLTPAYHWHEIPYYLTGLKLYDLLARRDDGFAPSRFVGREEALDRVPWLRAEDLRGTIEYHDGQFDDARLAIALARTAADHGAALANYTTSVTLSLSPRQSSGQAPGASSLRVRDEESGETFDVRAKAIVNACGIFADELRRLDDPSAAPFLALSRGTHVAIDPQAMRSNDAVLVPKTIDGRVVFAIPWHGRLLVGTTDVPAAEPVADPQPTDAEIAFLLETLAAYSNLRIDATRVTASWAGLRPLVARRPSSSTARVSREHFVDVSRNGLVTIAGGKWTTYRKMAQDTIDAAIDTAGLSYAACVTERLAVHDAAAEIGDLVAARPELARPLHPDFPYTLADAVNGFRTEMARSANDVLFRRTRIGMLDARAEQACRDEVEQILAAERP